jgi:DNA polymerase III delta prime subunit
MTSIIEFISSLNSKKEEIQIFFANYFKLIDSLKELNSMLGMTEIKHQVIKDIKDFIISKRKNKTQKKLRHCLIYGEPGTGKTSVAKILAKIWISIGYISREKKTKVNTLEELKDEIIKRKIDEIHFLKKKVNKAEEIISKTTIILEKCNKITLHLIKNKDNEMTSFVKDIKSIVSSMRESEEDIKIIEKMETLELNPEASKETVFIDDLVILSKNDLISQYVGGTPKKINDVLTNCLGHVVFIDEAYNLRQPIGFSKDDAYGSEALTTINEFMSKYPEQIIIIFAGYEKEIRENILEHQRGMPSRFSQVYRIEKYTPDELFLIFLKKT